MSEKVKSYQQGYADACVHIGDRVPGPMLLDAVSILRNAQGRVIEAKIVFE